MADLDDQAAWSSYTQDIPRVGNARRERIRLARYLRAMNMSFWRPIMVIVGVIVIVLFVAIIGALVTE